MSHWSWQRRHGASVKHLTRKKKNKQFNVSITEFLRERYVISSLFSFYIIPLLYFLIKLDHSAVHYKHDNVIYSTLIIQILIYKLQINCKNVHKFQREDDLFTVYCLIFKFLAPSRRYLGIFSLGRG